MNAIPPGMLAPPSAGNMVGLLKETAGRESVLLLRLCATAWLSGQFRASLAHMHFFAGDVQGSAGLAAPLGGAQPGSVRCSQNCELWPVKWAGALAQTARGGQDGSSQAFWNVCDQSEYPGGKITQGAGSRDCPAARVRHIEERLVRHVTTTRAQIARSLRGRQAPHTRLPYPPA